MAVIESLDFSTLQNLYRNRNLTVEQLVREVYARIAAGGDNKVWIHLVPIEKSLKRARELDACFQKPGVLPAGMPLFGLPFGIKDNIDLADEPTTAACPRYSYVPRESSPVVQRLVRAGAIPIGKTNLDQFATGLSGARSPYGACTSVCHSEYISGGSSSGSAVAVAGQFVSFALGTDTAGSGRVPAAFNNIVGLKPTRGLLSTRGVVPAVRSLDCVSIFALNCNDAMCAAESAKGFDPDDFFSREFADTQTFQNDEPRNRFKFGLPAKEELQFFGDGAAEDLFQRAVLRFKELGGEPVQIDYAPFRESAELLYNGPWLSERLAGLKKFADANPEALFPVTREVLKKGNHFSAIEVFEARARLEILKCDSLRQWARMDVMLLPTTGTIYTLKEMLADPIRLNSNLGYYTNFVNLLDCCALAVPAGFRQNGTPFGVTLIAPALKDGLLCALGERYHRSIK